MQKPKSLDEIHRDSFSGGQSRESSFPDMLPGAYRNTSADSGNDSRVNSFGPEKSSFSAEQYPSGFYSRDEEKNKKIKSSSKKRGKEEHKPRHKKDEKKELPKKEFSGKHVKLKSTLYDLSCFFRRHKVACTIAAVVIAVLLAGVLTVNHFLSKINYVEAEDYALQELQEENVKYITLSTGEVINVKNLKRNEDGTYTLPDGRRFNTDRTIWNTDGSMVFYDGSYMLPDGTAVLSNGTTFYTDELLVFQSGKFYEKTKISVDKDGYVKFYNGVIAHLTNFICAEDGTCTAKSSAIKSLKYDVSGSWNAFDKDKGKVEVKPIGDDDEDSKVKEALANASGLNDDAVASNYNNNEIWYSDEIRNILLMGIDEGSRNFPYGRSDAMIVISMNTRTKAVKMLSFSRAVYVAIAGYENTRLSHAHGYGGAALAIDTIERNYKIRIDNYVETGFETFKKIIDVLDGVALDLTSAEAYALKGKITKAGIPYVGAGKYVLNGELALEYVRLRRIDTDRERTARQRKVLMSLANKVKSQNPLQLTMLANQILPLITTDLSKMEILSQLANINAYINGDVQQSVVPQQSSELKLIDNFEVLIVDWKSEVKKLHNLLYQGTEPKYYAK